MIQIYTWQNVIMQMRLLAKLSACSTGFPQPSAKAIRVFSFCSLDKLAHPHRLPPDKSVVNESS